MSQNIHQPTNNDLLTTNTGEPTRNQFSIKITVQRGRITQREINMFVKKIEEAETIFQGGNIKHELE